MSKSIITDSALTGIADAIRTKNGSTTTYKPGEMPTAIANLDTTLSETMAAAGIPNVWEFTADSTPSGGLEAISGYGPLGGNTLVYGVPVIGADSISACFIDPYSIFLYTDSSSLYNRDSFSTISSIATFGKLLLLQATGNFFTTAENEYPRDLLDTGQSVAIQNFEYPMTKPLLADVDVFNSLQNMSDCLLTSNPELQGEVMSMTQILGEGMYSVTIETDDGDEITAFVMGDVIENLGLEAATDSDSGTSVYFTFPEAAVHLLP